MSVRIANINYNPPGRDVEQEHVVLRNTGASALNLSGWTLRDVAPVRPHIFTFGEVTVPAGGEVRVWTRDGVDSATDVHWGRDAAVWNNPGDTLILRSASGLDVSRFSYAPRAAGISPMRVSVPAYWQLTPAYMPFWNAVKAAGSVVSTTIIEGSWPEFAGVNAEFKAAAQAHLNTLPGAVLGYVSTRGADFNLLTADEILSGAGKKDSVKAWYDQFGGQIDGIYFDEIVLPEDPGSAAFAAALVQRLKAERPGVKAMILAGQCNDEVVMSPHIDWALMWESRYLPYKDNFYPLVLQNPADATNGTPIAQRPTIGTSVPSWWKNPAYREKIVHVVHNVEEPQRQHALGLANERNAGHVFIMDQRGLNASNKDELYDHLPPYWATEVSEVDSLLDFGFEPHRVLLAARRYGSAQGFFHAWPNFEGAWYNHGHVRGTYYLRQANGAVALDVRPEDLPGQPPLYDIPKVWAAAHQYAQLHGYETAIPTFEEVLGSGGIAYRLIAFPRNLGWLQRAKAPVAGAYQQPTFAEAGAVIRNVNRWAYGSGNKAGFPTFVPVVPADPRGRDGGYDCYVLTQAAPVEWRDVLTTEYLQQL